MNGDDDDDDDNENFNFLMSRKYEPVLLWVSVALHLNEL